MRAVRVRWAAILIVVAGIGLAACRGSDEPPVATMTPAVTQNPTSTATEAAATPTPSVEEEVAGAYLAYWDAYAEAVLNLDITLVEDLVSATERQRLLDEIEALRADGVALRVEVEHDFQVVPKSDTEVAVVDEIVNDSFYVDPVTKEPPEGTGSGEVLRYTFLMENIDDRWIVVSGSREASD